MADAQDRRIVIAGAGIAGLTAALAFARQGFAVELHEKAERLDPAGAGIQLSPNATRILRALDVLAPIEAVSLRAKAVSLRSARNGAEVTRLPLGRQAEERWGAPYLVLHRADLQAVLRERAQADANIHLKLGSSVTGVTTSPGGTSVTVETAAGTAVERCAFAIGADGVHSRLGRRNDTVGRPRYMAWRRTLPARSGELGRLGALASDRIVNAFMHPRFHLIAYPLHGGRDVNLVCVMPAGGSMEMALGGSELLSSLAANATEWTGWPIHELDPDISWTRPGLALIGDAAHAMAPFAAQGAAMAIEDAASLATLVGGSGDFEAALRCYEEQRRPRIRRVAARGRFNRFAWHAGWPVSVARDLVLRMRPGASLMADFDWLYGHDAMAPARGAPLSEGSG